MSYGLPSICHKTCGTKTYIKNQYNGFILEKINQNSIEQIIEKIIKDKKYMKILSKNCFNHFEENFSEIIYYKYFKNLVK